MPIEYRNKFLYFIIRPELSYSFSEEDKNFIYCSGVNLTRFLPLTKGRHRLGQNPAEKGLQSVNNEVKSLFLKIGAAVRTSGSNLCSDIKKLPQDVWYSESFFVSLPLNVSTNSLELDLRDILSYAVLNLFKKIFLAMMIDEQVPEVLPSSSELENYINRVLQKYQSK